MRRPQAIFIWTIVLLLGEMAMGESICGKFDLANKPTNFIRSFLDQYGLSNIKNRTQCGLPGEEYRVCLSCSDTITDDMMAIVRHMMSTPEHRKFHDQWHNIRKEATMASSTNTVQVDLAPPEKCPSVDPNPILTNPTFANRDFLKADPKVVATSRADLQSEGIKGNVDDFVRLHNFENGELAGEDFFYMHRQMIKMVNLELAYYGKPCIAPWTHLPSKADDSKWPIRKFENTESAAQAFTKLKQQEALLMKPEYLSKVSLAELGQCVEHTLHGMLHDIYNHRSGSCHGGNDVSETCDDLVPSWSSPVNPMFWKLHGFVDQFVGAWLAANKDQYNEISETCDGHSKCYSWKGKWLGNMPASSPASRNSEN